MAVALLDQHDRQSRVRRLKSIEGGKSAH
jgi:hypothetical protein